MKRRAFAGLLSILAAVALAAPPRTARAEDEPPKQEELPRRQANFAWDKNDKTGRRCSARAFRTATSSTRRWPRSSGAGSRR